MKKVLTKGVGCVKLRELHKATKLEAEYPLSPMG